MASDFGLSEAGVGVLAGAYAVGTLAAGPVWVVLGPRLGVRRLTGSGLLLLAAASGAFGLAGSDTVATASLFIEGIGGAACWAGGLAWVAGLAPQARRGELIGYVVAASSAGALCGPILGATAATLGRAPVFLACAALAAVLGAVALRARPEPEPPSRVRLRALRLTKGLTAACALTALLSGLTGALSVLGSLRLSAIGASAAVIGLAFSCAATIELGAGPLVGRLSDRRGRLAPIWLGLPVAAVLFASIPIPPDVWTLAVIVAVTGPVVGAMWTPSTALVGDTAQLAAVPLALAYVLNGFSWAIGRSIGSAATGVVLSSLGGRVAALAMAASALAGLTLLALAARKGHLASLRPAGRGRSPTSA
jgi:MFS family permease